MNIRQIQREASELQQAVDERELRSVLAGELAGEVIVSVTELAAGQFNNVYRVDTPVTSYILKVAPAADADVFYNERQLMLREQTLSGRLQSLGPLLPGYRSFFTVDGREAFLQPLVAGRLWDEVMISLSDAENAELWKQLGAFASMLHGHEAQRFGYPAPCEGFERWSGFIVDNVNGLVEDCRRLGIMCDEVKTYHDMLPDFAASLDEVTVPRLCHGDLWPKNVIIDGAGEDVHIKAVIDAERAYHGDPVSDWVLILYGVPQAFWTGYGENLLQTGDPARIAIYRGMYFIVNMLEAVRLRSSADAPSKWLSDINVELDRMLRVRMR